MNLKETLKWGIIGGIFLLPFVPLYVENSFFFPFITGKNFAFRIIVQVIASLWLILLSLDKESRPRKSPLLVSIAVFLLIIGVADIFSPNVMKSFWSNFERMEGFITLIHLGLYFIIAGTILNTEKLWTWFWGTSLGVSVIVGIHGIQQLRGLAEIHQGSVRLDASFGNATYLAVYSLFHIFLCLYFILKKETGKYARYVYGAIALLQTFIIYYTATRGAILGLIGGLFVASVLIAVFEKEWKVVRKTAIGFLVGIVVLVGGFLAVKDAPFVAKSQVLSRFASISFIERTTISRFLIWNMAWQGFTESPKTMFIGRGQESFNYVFNKYYSPEMWNQEQWFDRAHNIIFDWLTAGGALGLLAYLAMFGISLYLLWRKSGTKFSFAGKSIFTGLLLGYFFNNFFVFDNITSYLMFFAVLAFIHHSYCEAHPMPHNVGNENQHKRKREGSNELTISEEHTVAIVVPIVALVFGFVFYFADWKPIATASTLARALPNRMVDAKTGQELAPETVAAKRLELFRQAFGYNTFGVSEIREQLLQAASQVASLNIPVETKQEFLMFAKDELEKQIKATPEDARYEVFLGSFLSRFGAFDLGLSHLRRALELSPKKQTIMFEIGGVLINQKKYNEALTILKQAFDSAPEFEQARIMYAVGAIYAGQNNLVAEILEPIAASSALFDDRIVQAYVDTNQYAKLVPIFTARISANPQDTDSYSSLAASYIKLGRRADAIATLEKAIQAVPSFKTQGEEFIRQIRAGEV